MLNNIGLPGILLIAVVVLVLFGRGKISGLMGEVGKGITSFKRGTCLIWVGPSCWSLGSWRLS
ncbi:MAG: hypothetical protein EBX06_00710 [Rhodobacteraceae bacterium]|nr:hypothetical protein [Paracoccaceae bacterium]